MKRLTVILDDDIHQNLKLMCVEQHTDMSDVVRKLIERYVKSQRAKKKGKH